MPGRSGEGRSDMNRIPRHAIGLLVVERGLFDDQILHRHILVARACGGIDGLHLIDHIHAGLDPCRNTIPPAILPWIIEKLIVRH